MSGKPPLAHRAIAVPPRAVAPACPPGLAAKLGGRGKRVLGDRFGLQNLGVNLTRLPPGAASALHHANTVSEAGFRIPEGEPMPIADAGEAPLGPDLRAEMGADGRWPYARKDGTPLP